MSTAHRPPSTSSETLSTIPRTASNSGALSTAASCAATAPSRSPTTSPSPCEKPSPAFFPTTSLPFPSHPSGSSPRGAATPDSHSEFPTFPKTPSTIFAWPSTRPGPIHADPLLPATASFPAASEPAFPAPQRSSAAENYQRPQHMHDGIHHTLFHVRVTQCSDGGCAVAHTEYIERETAAVLLFGPTSDDLEVRQNFWCKIAVRANLRRGGTRFPDDPDPALRLARRPPSRPCNTMAKCHSALRKAGSEIPASRSSSRPAAPPSTMPSPCLNLQRRVARPPPPAKARRPSPHPVSCPSHAVQ